MQTRVRGWRWRHNPLRRRSDVVEAWTTLVVAVLLCVGAPLAGIATGWRAYDGARATAAEQRAERHRVRAEVIEHAPPAVPTTHGDRQPAYRVTVRWAEAGERPRTEKTRVSADTRIGDRTYIWLDDRGRIVPAPPDATAVWQHALAASACTTGFVAGVVLVARFVVGRVAERRRMAEWGREWARTGPEWRRHWA
ncbi:Rv1733c family protein [Streptomyces sp. 2A115]|uniref:Rv1733c family protein n=1 Tax=Streptomyces sp. 2A115 TaxID=3457439 RepID=UPI003FD6B561